MNLLLIILILILIITLYFTLITINKNISKIDSNITKYPITTKYSTTTKYPTTTKSIRDLSIKPTMSDGNCFYSSVYRSLIDKGFLNNLYDCIPQLKSSDELNFIINLREYTALYAINDIKNMFNYFIEEFDKGMDEQTFLENIKYLGGIYNVLLQYKKENKFQKQYEDDFVKDIQDIIKTNTIYAGEIEVTNVIKILKNCGIEVKIFNNYEKAKKYISNISDKEYNNTLFFLNLGELHWVYI
jgi:hypothetical protein